MHPMMTAAAERLPVRWAALDGSPANNGQASTGYYIAASKFWFSIPLSGSAKKYDEGSEGKTRRPDRAPGRRV